VADTLGRRIEVYTVNGVRPGSEAVPRHPRLPEKGKVLPMCPVRSVTYVSGRSCNKPFRRWASNCAHWRFRRDRLDLGISGPGQLAIYSGSARRADHDRNRSNGAILYRLFPDRSW
jgi:hypothetical protein